MLHDFQAYRGASSYFAPAGGFALTQDFFANAGIDNPPLHALQAGVEGVNGVYTYGATSSFPVSTSRSSSYWVDVAFLPAGS